MASFDLKNCTSGGGTACSSVCPLSRFHSHVKRTMDRCETTRPSVHCSPSLIHRMLFVVFSELSDSTSHAINDIIDLSVTLVGLIYFIVRQNRIAHLPLQHARSRQVYAATSFSSPRIPRCPAISCRSSRRTYSSRYSSGDSCSIVPRAFHSWSIPRVAACSPCGTTGYVRRSSSAHNNNNTNVNSSTNSSSNRSSANVTSSLDVHSSFSRRSSCSFPRSSPSAFRTWNSFSLSPVQRADN